MEIMLILMVLSIILLIVVVVWLAIYVEMDSKMDSLAVIFVIFGLFSIFGLGFSSYNYSYYNLTDSIESEEMAIERSGYRVSGKDTVYLYSIRKISETKK